MFGKDEIIVHRRQDGYGPIVVTEDALTRILYFGSTNRQSRMLLNRPAIPVMKYMQGVLASLAFCPSPAQVTILGLGGGNLASFFLKYLPGCKVTVVELREAVIEVARDYFGFPAAHPDVEVVHADAREYLAQTKQQADLLVVDLFDAHGPVPFVLEEHFLSQCHDATSDQGITIYNYWNRKQDKVGRFVSKLQNINYNGGVQGYDVNPGHGNIVLYSSPFATVEQVAANINPSVNILQAQICLDFEQVLADIICYGKAGKWRSIFHQPARLSDCVI